MKEIRMPNDEYAYFYSRYDTPVAEVELGEEVAVFTEDAFGGLIESEEQLVSTVYGVKVKYFNPVTGPIYVKGVEAGDTLVVKIHKIENTSGHAVSATIQGMGALSPSGGTRMLTELIPEKVWIYDYADGIFTCRTNPKLSYPEKPFSGSLGTAPDVEIINSVVPTNIGGNMDVSDMCPGNTLYFPAMVDGAYFYIGDAHGRQGDGELTGTALEMAAKITLEFDVVKGKCVKQPRIENDEYIMCVGSAKPMEDAARMAWCELINWMHEDYGWDPLDAYEALSQVGEMYVGNMVDPNYSMVAKIKKKYL